jgi:MFS family permease
MQPRKACQPILTASVVRQTAEQCQLNVCERNALAVSGTESASEGHAARRTRLPGVLVPLRHRDYRLLAVGSLVSYLGDGFFLVAIALQVLAITGNSTLAVGAVGATWAGSAALVYLIGGWAGDRFARRRIMVSADIVRGVAVGLMGLLGATGALQLWHVIVVGLVIGSGNAFFNPAANAIVPELLPSEDLPRANAFRSTASSTMLNLAGPALGGFVVAATQPATAFLIDSATFFFSAALLSLIQVKPREPESGLESGPETARTGLVAEVREGLAYVRTHSWCWAYIVGIGVSLLLWAGPLQVLLPLILKVNLGLGEEGAARLLGLIFASSGLGSMVAATLIGQRRDLPRRFVTLMYIAEAVAILTVGVYGVMEAGWQGVAAAFVAGGLFAVGEIHWETMVQRLVPGRLLSRVGSVQRLVSTGLFPVGLVVAGLLGAVVDPQQVVLAAAVLGAGAILALLLVPGVRNPENQPEARAPGEPERPASTVSELPPAPDQPILPFPQPRP